VMNVDGAGVLHAARKQGISGGTQENHGENHEILSKPQ